VGVSANEGKGDGDGLAGGADAGAVVPDTGAGLCLRAWASALPRLTFGSGGWSMLRAAGIGGDGGALSTGATGGRTGAAASAGRGAGAGRRKAIETDLSCGVASTATVCSVTNKSCPLTSTRARTV
jgi:hypothetical protein